MTKWWKCDLQVATPAWRFSLPTGLSGDMQDPATRVRVADAYMLALREKGIDVISLAAHNSAEWIDEMKAAGERHGVTVFPGVEITTGSGSDGVHLLVIGGLELTSQDMDRHIHGFLGFDASNPTFDPSSGNPTPSGRGLTDILDALPEDCLAIAPHALGDNGIASGSSMQGSIKWQALHHPRLAAVDPGDCAANDSDGHNRRFRERALSNYPCLDSLAFVHTSDAYSFDDFGSKFSWIRMDEPSLEGLRQACLDHESRIICSWDSRLDSYPDRDPNRVRHAWVKSIELGSGVSNAEDDTTIDLHPGLNVLIGGRGSGKSTVITALRRVFAGFDELPARLRSEIEGFANDVFDGAELRAVQCAAHSQDEQRVTWTKSQGTTATRVTDGAAVPLIDVRVFNQKELFERVSPGRHSAEAASSSIIQLVDSSAGVASDDTEAGSWSDRYSQAKKRWSSTISETERLRRSAAQLPAAQAKLDEIKRQIRALEAEDTKARREANAQRLLEQKFLDRYVADSREWLDRVEAAANHARPGHTATNSHPGFVGLQSQLDELRRGWDRVVSELITAGRQQLWQMDTTIAESEWATAVAASVADDQELTEELRRAGVDPAEYQQLKKQREEQEALVAIHERDRHGLAAAEAEVVLAASEIESLALSRRSSRKVLLDDIASRSATLRFNIQAEAATQSWVTRIRSLMQLRADGFLDDVPTTARWLWTADDVAERDRRHGLWVAALSRASAATDLKDENAGRTKWLEKLDSLDESIRLVIAAERPDDVVEMDFKNGDEWQDVLTGSPGQRTAAMLAFVLHHGDEPLMLDQPEDDLDAEFITTFLLPELRRSRWHRQIVIATHNANIPVNGDAERVIVLENASGQIRIRAGGDGELHIGAIERTPVRNDIQSIMEGGVRAFVSRERKYKNEIRHLNYSRPLVVSP